MTLEELKAEALAGTLYGSIDDPDGVRVLGHAEVVQTVAGLRWHIGCDDGYFEVPPEVAVPVMPDR